MMVAMEISTSLVFPADPVTVFAMVTDPGFLEEVAREARATECSVNVQGLTTTSSRSLQAPAEAEKITGPAIHIVETRTWSAAAPDGSRTANLDLRVSGQPITMDGNIRLRPAGNHTRIDIAGDLKVKIPLIGKKLEKLAAPAVEDGIRAEERVGLRRLQG